MSYHAQNASVATSVKTLLTGAIIAGPLFTIVGLAQAITRPGFDLSKHALSLLSNGDLGWIQISNFLLTGLLFIIGAIGIRRAIGGSRGGTWGPLLVGICGVGLMGAGIFLPDPGLGFPQGSVSDGMSTHGLLHMIMGSLSFLTMIAACFVFTRRFITRGQRGLAIYAAVSAVIFFISFAGVVSGNLWMNSAFVFTALNAYICLSIIAASLRTESIHTA